MWVQGREDKESPSEVHERRRAINKYEEKTNRKERGDKKSPSKACEGRMGGNI